MQTECEQFELKPDAKRPLHSLFVQRVSRKARELWKLYLNNPALDGTKVPELRRLQKVKRHHLSPSVAGLDFTQARPDE